MYKIAVIADDFTSVTDCTISFACKGMSTAALTNVSETEYPESEVIGLNTESRTLLPEEAYYWNQKAALQLKSQKCEVIYKSVDSTLRGNLGAEIDGVMDGYGYDLAFVAPAFPHYGRTTVKGTHYLNGCLLEESPIAKDPTCPAKESVIIDILGKQSKRKMANLGLELLRGSKSHFVDYVNSLKNEGVEIIVADAETEEDLERVAMYSKEFPNALIVGSTGLARHVASCYFETGMDKQTYQKSCKPVIIAAASVSPITKGQVEVVSEQGNAGLCLLEPTKIAFGETETYVEDAKEILRQGKNLILYVDSRPEVRAHSEQERVKKGISSKELGEMITAGMGAVVKILLEQGLSDSIIMTGGDMAKASLETLESNGMMLYAEVEPGIPVGRMVGYGEYLMVTKAGAFGTPQALLKAIQLLKEE